MPEFGVVFDAFHLILDYLVDLGTDALVIILDLCFHAVISVLILKDCYIRNRDISGSLACYGVVVNDNLGMEYFLVDFLIEIITDYNRANEMCTFYKRNVQKKDFFSRQTKSV